MANHNGKDRIAEVLRAVAIAAVVGIAVAILVCNSGCMSGELEEALNQAQAAEAEAQQIREEEGRARQDAIAQLDDAIQSVKGNRLTRFIGRFGFRLNFPGNRYSN